MQNLIFSSQYSIFSVTSLSYNSNAFDAHLLSIIIGSQLLILVFIITSVSDNLLNILCKLWYFFQDSLMNKSFQRKVFIC